MRRKHSLHISLTLSSNKLNGRVAYTAKYVFGLGWILWNIFSVFSRSKFGIFAYSIIIDKNAIGIKNFRIISQTIRIDLKKKKFWKKIFFAVGGANRFWMWYYILYMTVYCVNTVFAPTNVTSFLPLVFPVIKVFFCILRQELVWKFKLRCRLAMNGYKRKR